MHKALLTFQSSLYAVLALFFLLVSSSLFAVDNDAIRLHRFGIFVGANDGGVGRTKLQWALSDARRLAAVMQETGGIAREDCVILNQPLTVELLARLRNIRDSIRREQTAGKHAEVFFYYSGHSDESGLLLGEEKLSYLELRKAITDLKADVSVAILDSCASGAFTRIKGGVRVQPFLSDSSVDAKGYAFLTSSSESEASQESDQLAGSFFTHFLVSGLRGAADLSGDGKVTLNEAYNYAFSETLSRTEGTSVGAQHPSYDIQLKGSGELVLSDLSIPTGILVFSEPLLGRFFIRDTRGVLVAEVHKSAGKSLTIALPPGSYTIRADVGNTLWTAQAVTTTGSRTNLAVANFTIKMAQANRTRGSTNEPSPTTTPNPQPVSTPSLENRILNSIDSALIAAGLNLAENEKNKPGSPPTSSAPPALPAGNNSTSGQTASDLPSETSIDTPTGASQSAPENVIETTPVYKPGLFNVQVYPGLGTVEPSDKKRSLVSMGFISSTGRSTGIQFGLLGARSVEAMGGIQWGGLWADAGGPALGLQHAGIYAVTHREFTGYQSGGIFAIVEGTMVGYQNGGIFTTAANLTGVQSAGIFSIAKKTKGLQASGVFSVAEDFSGMQVSGLFNKADTFNGVQASGFFNSANALHGLQTAAFLNLASSVQGMQLGVLNISSGMVHGSQIGIVNYADDTDGLSLGIFSWVQKGIHEFSIGIAGRADTMLFQITNGSRTLWTRLEYGIEFDRSLFMPGAIVNGTYLDLALGLRFGPGPIHGEVGTGLKYYSPGEAGGNEFSALFSGSDKDSTTHNSQLRLVPHVLAALRFDVDSHFSVWFGPTFDIVDSRLISFERYQRQGYTAARISDPNNNGGATRFFLGTSMGVTLKL